MFVCKCRLQKLYLDGFETFTNICIVIRAKKIHDLTQELLDHHNPKGNTPTLVLIQKDVQPFLFVSP